jgi:type I restriction enzyme S subunit
MKFLLHFLRANEDKISNLGTGSTFKAITISELKKLQIPLPPLPQQKKIAAILDSADTYRQKTKALIAKYDELTQSLFLDMFGDPVKNEKGWEKVATIKYCESIVPGRDKPKSFTGNIPWVTTNDLNHLGITIGSKSNIGLSEEEIKEVKAKIIPEESVIMTCVGDLGLVTVNKVKMVVNQQLHAFICSEKLNSTFLMYNLFHQKPYMLKMASSTTVPYMNKTVCNNIPTILPPITLQTQFAERVQAIEEQKAQAQASLVKAEELFNSLLQKAFNGELV